MKNVDPEKIPEPEIFLSTSEEDLDEQEYALNRARLKIVLLTVVINIVAVIAFTFMPWSDWRTGLALSIVDNLILLGFGIYHRDKLMGYLLTFGLIVGMVELTADAWLVDFTRTLDYSPGGGPMVWRSPIWMPLAWEIVAIQFAVIGGYLTDRWGSWGLPVVGLLGALVIPFYSEMALKTNWWAYSNCKMFLNTPHFIIVGVFFIAIVFAILHGMLQARRMGETIVAGFIGGIDILLCYAGAYCLIEAATLGG